MKFKISEKLKLDEAQFQGYYHLLKHFDAHVLQDGEEFSTDDPKFSPMTMQEYAKAAKELTESPARIIDNIDELSNANSGIVGWVASDPRWGGNRAIKINLNSPHRPGFIEIVGHKEDPNDDQIFTYMLARPNKKYREFKRKVDELIENKPRM